MPAVMVIHGGNWNAQSGDSSHVARAAQDIANEGFFVVSVWYELAPPNYIPRQPCWPTPDPSATPTPGMRMIREVNDIKALVRALRVDPRCNGKVGVVGGSAGATHAVTVALDKTTPPPSATPWPHWCEDPPYDDRPVCAVMLSAIYDFSDWTPPTGQTETDFGFRKDGLENYAQTLDLNTLANLPLNPVVLLSEAHQQHWGFKHLFLINSYCDAPTAYHQIVKMSCALEAKGLVLDVDYKRLTIPGPAHAFGYWDTVKDEVIAFLNCELKNECEPGQLKH
jgi:pimeloyl-ACP methyl ester carboxylesterase